MADDHELHSMARVNPRSFFHTFLNVRENSEGYDGTAISSERNRTVKALIKPCRPCSGDHSGGWCGIVPHGSLGRLMFEFAWNKSTLNKADVSHANHQENEISSKGAPGGELNCTVNSDARVDVGRDLEFLLSSKQPSSKKLLLDTNKTKVFKSSIPERISSNNSSRGDNFIQTEKISISDNCYDGDDKDESSGCNDYGDGVEDVDEYDIRDGDDNIDSYDGDKELSINDASASQLYGCLNSAVSETTQSSDNDELLFVTPESHGSIGNKNCSTRKDTCVHEVEDSVKQEKVDVNVGIAKNKCLNICSNQISCPDGFQHEIPGKVANDFLKQSEGSQPSTWYKGQSSSSTQMADMLLKFKLSLLESILLEPENKIDADNLDDYQLCGKFAVLMGCHTESNTPVVQLTHTLSVGFFNFLDGTVKPHECSEAIKNQFLSTTETRPLEQVIEELQVSFRKHSLLSQDVSIADVNKISMFDVPQAWVITSPGLGVFLDNELKRTLGTLLEGTALRTTDTQKPHNDLSDLKWQYLVMLLDEYRRTEDGFPVTEVYELDVGGKHRPVNFEIL